MLPSLNIVTDPISFLVMYNSFCFGSVLFDAICFIISFKKNEHKILDVIIVCCFCCLSLSFVLTCFLNDGLSLQSNAAFFTTLSYLRCRLSFFIPHFFLRNTVPHLVDIYAKNLDERVRSFICERTLPSLLVGIYFKKRTQ